MRSLPVFMSFALAGLAAAQNIAPSNSPGRLALAADSHKPAPSAANDAAVAAANANAAVMQASLDRLTKSNAELLDLLKKQQSVLEDIQYDRRLQSRQISLLEERLEETLQQNAQLQTKITSLAATAANPAPATSPSGATASARPTPTPLPSPTPTPRPPGSYLPLPETEGMAGTMSWHRLFILTGTEGQNSNIFHIQGRQWRVLWHNQDKDGKAYDNTSALFISAFPKDDTIPQKVCSRLGTGGDSTELLGPGYYYLRIEASGGSWELAVEDFR